ncbi:MAG: UvrB/UvrC motif-containing protein [Verrucomicrobiota bacterium]|nr:UvrB/UvrC motif-containing protein [Verrucomicrobiota bacterium]MDG1893210.1 UvrB/UvrC motif-containing protein [Verrucomicrobiota bacterium]
MTDWDISHVLESWVYEPGKAMVRKIEGKHGGQLIQMRIDLGVLQMHASGRPDGQRPHGLDSLLDHHIERLESHLAACDGDDADFKLTAEECVSLQQEAIQFHHRYICFFQLELYEEVIQDADRNLDAIEMVDQYGPGDQMSWTLRQLTPQLLLMRTRAVSALSLAENDYEQAIRDVEEGIEALQTFIKDHMAGESPEQNSELQALQQWLEEVRGSRPLSQREKLEKELDEAVAKEDYERAAEVRDALKCLSAAD